MIADSNSFGIRDNIFVIIVRHCRIINMWYKLKIYKRLQLLHISTFLFDMGVSKEQ